MISENWTRENLSWAAGLFEGEGCIRFKTRIRSSGRIDNHTGISLSSTDEDVVRKFLSIVGVGKIYGPYTRGRYKPHWIWKVDKRDHAYAFLCSIYSFLGKRRKERAEEFLNWYRPLYSMRRKSIQ